MCHPSALCTGHCAQGEIWYVTSKLKRQVENLARHTVSARGDVRRGGDELLSLFRSRDAGRALPVRRTGTRDARRPSRNDGALLARLPAERRSRPAIRVPRVRTVGPAQRASLQSEQAAARSVREGGRRTGAVERRRVSVSIQASGK